MHITDEMLRAAVAKSVEAGLLPRRALKEDFYDAQEMMRMILQSALSDMNQADANHSEQKTSTVSKTGKSASATRPQLIPVELQNFY